MHIYTVFAAIILLVTLITYINQQTIQLQTTIAIMLSSSLLAFGIIIGGQLGWLHLNIDAIQLVQNLDFNHLLLKGMLSFLLFAGALHVNVHDLRYHKWEITVLAGFSTIASCLLVGAACYWLSAALHVPIPWLYCFLFGALISPTDPIAVLATFKKLEAPKNLYAIVAGESLFNDGVGVVLFLTIYHLIVTGQVTTGETLLLFAQQTGGGIIYGSVLGVAVKYLLDRCTDYHVKILLTLSVVSAGYLLAFQWDISGPLAMVMAGLIIGHHPDHNAPTHPVLFQFWEIIDELLNAVLFCLIGIELITLSFADHTWLIAILSIPMVLIIRTITIWCPMAWFKRHRRYCPLINTLLVWGGLRGGLAIALALGMPRSPHNQTILAMTFAVVFFSIAIQGLTTPKLVMRSKTKPS